MPLINKRDRKSDCRKVGATVVIISARNTPENENSNLHFIASDLSKAEGTQKVVNEVLSTYGQLDILVNNLSYSSTPAGGFNALTDKDWESTLQTNLLAPIRDREFLPKMILIIWLNNIISRIESL